MTDEHAGHWYDRTHPWWKPRTYRKHAKGLAMMVRWQWWIARRTHLQRKHGKGEIEVIEHYARRLRWRMLGLVSLERCIAMIEEHLPKPQPYTPLVMFRLRPVASRCVLCGGPALIYKRGEPPRTVCVLCPPPAIRPQVGELQPWQKELRTRLAFARSMRERPPPHTFRISAKSRFKFFPELFKKVPR